MMELWPFTNFHDLNLDWIIRTIKNWVSKMQNFVDTMTADWQQMEDDWQEFIDSTYKDQITEILEDHPEWTTTVMDGAITEPKINAAFLKEIKNPFVIPEMFGAVGDGVTNDTQAFKAFLAHCYETGNLGILPDKTYLVDPLVFNYDSAVESFTLIGVNKMKSVLKLSAPGWFANTGTQNLFNKAYFKNINFQGYNGTGYGFYTWSDGVAKQLRFDDCFFGLDGIIETAGTGNADINTLFNCSGYLNEYLIRNNNSQSICTSVIQGDFVCYKDIIRAVRGGCINFIGGAYDLLGSNRGFVVNAENLEALGPGNWEYNFDDVRFELHNADQGAFSGRSGYPIKVCFDSCNFGTVIQEADNFCNVQTGHAIYFNNCTLDDNCKYKANSSQARGIGALLVFRDSCIGRTKTLAPRITVAGNTARVISTGSYMAPSDIGMDDGRANDFDFGWMNNKARSVLPATEKIMPLKPTGVAWPFNDGTTNIRIYPPVGSQLKNIYIDIPTNTASGNTCTLKITSIDGTRTYYESNPFTFSSGLHADVILNETVVDGLLMTMTNTQGVTFYSTSGIALIKYI